MARMYTHTLGTRRQTSGLICCWSLKNPSYPEYTFTTESGVMSLDFHPQHGSLLAVGLYDGTVMIFDICNRYIVMAYIVMAYIVMAYMTAAVMIFDACNRVNKPIFQSNVKNGKHTDPVWQAITLLTPHSSLLTRTLHGHL